MLYIVSVSLRSIIHSYLEEIGFSWKLLERCFRLLTEYHSFLCAEYIGNLRADMVSVSLQSIIHSYLQPIDKPLIRDNQVSFRLLTEYHSFLCSTPTEVLIKQLKSGFRLLTEYHSFL